jgi:small-conductance mechanosensitive channel
MAEITHLIDQIYGWLQKHPLTYQLLLAALILMATVLVKRYLVGLVIKRMARSEFMQEDPTQYSFIRSLVSIGIYIIGFGIAISMIPQLRALSASLLAGAGIFAAVLGFAAQQAFGNLVSGIFIVMFKPFRVGDFVFIEDKFGTVEDINMRHTTLRSIESKRIVIPNSTMSTATITNNDLVDPKTCALFEIGISYYSDIDRAIELIRDEAVKHPNYIDNRSEEELAQGKHPVNAFVLSLNDSSVVLRAYIWANTGGEAFQIKVDLQRSVKYRFDEAGIVIPFPHVTVVNHPEYEGDVSSSAKLMQ